MVLQFLDVLLSDGLWRLVLAPGPALTGEEVEAAARLNVGATAVGDVVVEERHHMTEQARV